MRDKPFDVLIKTIIANMMSVDWATHLVDEGEVKGGRGDPRLNKSHQQKEDYDPEKQFKKHPFKTDTIYFEIFKLSTSFLF